MQKRILCSERWVKPLWVHCIFILILASGCQRNLTTVSAEKVSGTYIDVVQPTLPDALNHPVYQNLRQVNPVFAFYSNRNFKPFWYEQNELTDKGKSMIEMVGLARRFGLLPQDYHAQEILQAKLPSDHSNVLRREVLLTDAFLAMAKDLNYGRANSNAPAESDSLKVANLADSLSLFGVKAVLESQEPRFKEYQNLRAALNTLLDTVAVAHQSLLLKGITNDSSEVHRMVQAIEVNLERWRMESSSLDGTYAWVNIPAYMFYVIEDHEVVLESRVVVGKPVNETPRFSSKIECFIVFPYWYVPRRISVQEYLPAIKKDTVFLTRNNFDVLDKNGTIQDPSSIDWKKLTPNNFPYTLRQREGTENSLGVLKFVFDNPYAVFVHDTNAKILFNNKKRALSHGCIRLEKAYEFAHYLIDGRSKITRETLDRYLKTEKKATVNLIPSVPIHFRYYTCEVRDERLVMYDDIYQLDGKLIVKLYKDGNIVEF